MTILICTTAVLICLLSGFVFGFIIDGIGAMQSRHYEFLERKEFAKDSVKLSAELQKKLDDFENLKKRIDVLTLKIGMKL